ncbi:hypothetical protein BHU72_10260 [Desulfuribacillus stibiiarsenatis]|uniref:Uncharacterized protein n=1 Tax=Desulfuribacillus stibiiarsenatis TaxID=1390249 RepID=A0A1E5L9F7_9FIRM|nr:cation diffusion facilitator family transporter [Desulfuribacillus stibiiarsenatis]OEH86629.1 hypothetical protein BHU72_10260 [Desulfuribacillus stibiiarsenatis]
MGNVGEDLEKEERYRLGKKATYIGIIGNVILTIFKAIIGFISGSMAMVADAFHSLSDVLGSVIVLWGLKLAQKPADANHHYGHGKAESVVAKLIAFLLFLTGLGVAYAAYTTLIQPVIEIPQKAALWAAGISIISKEAMYRYTMNVANKIGSSAIKADAWHHRTDALSSVAALIGIGGALLGYPILDPVAGIIVAIMIGYAAIEIYWTATKELMDEAPSSEILDKIKEVALTVEGVYTVQDVKGRFNGPRIFIDMKICVNKDLTVEVGHQIAGKAKHQILTEMKDVEDVLIHVNPCEHTSKPT